MPVAVTMAWASPPVHTVPLNTTSRASSSGPLTSGVSAERATGADSPVSVDMSTSTAPVISRASAQMLSPSSTISTSPGTRRCASTSCRRPSRHTRAWEGRNAANASTARSACTSWKNAKAALSTITAAMAIASDGVPLIQASTAATASTSASGWVNCRASSDGHRRPPRPASSLGPYATSLRAASRSESPSGELRRCCNNNANGSSGSASVEVSPSSSAGFAPTTVCWAITTFDSGLHPTEAGPRIRRRRQESSRQTPMSGTRVPAR
jgi:hypothetical protein